jgi:fructose-bisphosphate aldolase, class I
MDQEVKDNLKFIAQKMVAPGKGILAADESTGTIEKRLAKINLPSTEGNRRAYRELLFTTPGIGEYISGVIMFDETIRQSASGGESFVSVLEKAGILPGIKVDAGTENMPGSPDEKITKGLEELPERLAEYVKLGAKFAKWRAVITIGDSPTGGIPTQACIKENAKKLAEYAKDCQEAGLVPIVEPEVLMDGCHTIQKCEEVTEQVLSTVFEELKNYQVAMEGMVLKPNMVISAKEAPVKASASEIAKATLRVFDKVLPNNLAGIAFLSGGQSEVEASINLNEINKIARGRLEVSFSYGRALQGSALEAWRGRSENVESAQEAFLHRAKMNSMAREGKYSQELENKINTN